MSSFFKSMTERDRQHSEALAENILGDIDKLRTDISVLVEEALKDPDDFDKITAILRLVKSRTAELSTEAKLIVSEQVVIKDVEIDKRLAELLGEKAIFLWPSDLRILNTIFINSSLKSNYTTNAAELSNSIKVHYGINISIRTLQVYIVRLKKRLVKFKVPVKVAREKNGYVIRAKESNS